MSSRIRVEDVAVAAPGSTSSLRVANQHRVIKVLQDTVDGPSGDPGRHRPGHQAGPATVSNIVRELHAAGFVETTAGAGRRGTSVRIARGAGLVRGHRLRAPARPGRGRRPLRLILAETSREISPSHALEEGLELAIKLRDELLAALAALPASVLAIGLGLPAPIGADGLVVSSSILPGWVGVRRRRVAAGAARQAGIIDNDANLGALAEYRRGAGIGHPCMVYLKVSSGVGAGLIIDGRLFRGGGGTAGEIGHLTLDESGPVCRCGNRGCLEAYTSVTTSRSCSPFNTRTQPSRRSSRPPASRTPLPGGSSRTPAVSSAGGWPWWRTCSTPPASSSAATWRRPATCCWTPSGPVFADMRSARSGHGAAPHRPPRRPGLGRRVRCCWRSTVSSPCCPDIGSCRMARLW